MTTPLLSVTVIASSPLVALMTTVSAWPSPTPLPGVAPRSMATCLHVGPGQIVDRDGVGAAQGVDIDASRCC